MGLNVICNNWYEKWKIVVEHECQKCEKLFLGMFK